MPLSTSISGWQHDGDEQDDHQLHAYSSKELLKASNQPQLPRFNPSQAQQQ